MKRRSLGLHQSGAHNQERATSKRAGLLERRGLFKRGEGAGGGGGLIEDLGLGFTVLSPLPKIVKLIVLYK